VLPAVPAKSPRYISLIAASKISRQAAPRRPYGLVDRGVGVGCGSGIGIGDRDRAELGAADLVRGFPLRPVRID
jgi:hypothetical protein